jgi:hypothetical protein
MIASGKLEGDGRWKWTCKAGIKDIVVEPI